MDINVTKRDGSQEPYDADRINESVLRAARGLPDALALAMRVTSELRLTLHDGMSTSDLDESTISVAIGAARDAPEYDTIATRLRLKTIYKQVLGDDVDVASATREAFLDYVRAGIVAGRLDPRLERIDLEALADAIDVRRDHLLHFLGITTLRSRYLQTDADGALLETPQMCWARVAAGLAVEDPDPTAAALEIYHSTSELRAMPAGSIIVNAGTNHPQLSNCFVIDMEDDIDHIAKTLGDVMHISKGTGGLGLSAQKLRSSGSPVRSNDTYSTGPIPFLHTIDSTLRAISRNGKKFGALAIYLENWHLDYEDFLELREAAGPDPYRLIRTANTATWISDEFMRRVEGDEQWYLFDPAEVSDLTELYGEAFSRRYNHYVNLAEVGGIARFHKVPARELWEKMLGKLQTTGHPWITFKDAANLRANNDNTGTIHLSNLCTEVFLPQDRDNISVCNLTSVNLSTHLVDGEWDWEQLERTVRTAVRGLDDLVDVTRSGVAETERSNEVNRAVGLGFMGFTDVLERLAIPYDSPEAAALAGQLTEFISWHAINMSCSLAEDRGSYPNFDGSGWSRGQVPVDTLKRLSAERGTDAGSLPEAVETLDWDYLRERVTGGIRNATLMAIAPTANIGNVAGTTLGLDPQFGQAFSRDTAAGKFLEVNRNLVAALRAYGLWDTLRDDLIAARGDLTQVDGVPDAVRAVYQTSFNIAPSAFVAVAAAAQVWVDQGISRNMYLTERDFDSVSEVYLGAWRAGLKSTYYAHFRPRQHAEQSTVRVNKASLPGGGSEQSGGAGSGGRRGFGGRRRTPATGAPVPSAAAPTPEQRPALSLVRESAPEPAPACPIDPQERENCDSCQ